MTTLNENIIREINSKAPDAFLLKAKKRGYICPFCSNGTGKDGDGLVKNPKTGKYKCFKCGFSGDIIDLIGAQFNLTDFNEKVNKAISLYGVNDISYKQEEKNRKKVTEIIKAVTQTKNLDSYYRKCHQNIASCSYLMDRGISKEVIDEFTLGYDDKFDDFGKLEHPMQAIILPTSEDSFEARNISISPGGSGFRYYKHGASRIFNLSALSEEKNRPIFVVEGFIDALSILTCGGQAIGLCSAGNYLRLLDHLNTITPAQPLILLLDTDERGQKDEKSLIEGLEKKHILFYRGDELLKGFHDANDRLLKDAAGFKKAIGDFQTKIIEISNSKDYTQHDYLKASAGKSISDFIKTILSNAKCPVLSTGFTKIDNALDGGIYTGLYIIGAISSLGKTTLMLQIADNLAREGNDVLYFALEQSKYDLMSKSISRETFLYCKENHIDIVNAKSNLAILDGRRWEFFSQKEKEVLDAAITRYSGYADHVYIYEGIDNIAVEDIHERVKEHISFTGNDHPIVIIDYLQILKASADSKQGSDKQIMDRNITALKHLSRDFNIPVFAISSLNRQSYMDKINMSAYKESGAIEYGADVLIGLQYHGAGSNGFDIDKVKDVNERKIDFCILKQRNFKTCSKGIPLTYYTEYNCFSNDAHL